LIGAVAAFVVVITIFGPENHGSEFEKHKVAFESGAGDDQSATDAASTSSGNYEFGNEKRPGIVGETKV